MSAAETPPTICSQASHREKAPRPSSRRLFFWLSLFAAASVSALLETAVAEAQGEPAPVPVEAAPPPTPAPMETAPVVLVPAAPPEAAPAPAPVTTEDPALRATEPPDAPAKAEPVFTPKLTVGIGLRTGLSLAFNPGDEVTFRLADSLDQLMFRPFFAGQLTKNVGVFVQLNAGARSIEVLDAYVDLKLIDEFQFVLGQHIPANDRNNFCGPFFNNSWNFAAVPSFPFDSGARDRGFTFWGMETYFGSQDVLSVGAIISYQNGADASDGATDVNMDGEIDNDFVGFAADALFEKNLGGAGTITLQAGYWNWEGTGKDYVVNQFSDDSGRGYVGTLSSEFVSGQSFQAGASWLAPTKLGVGQKIKLPVKK